MSDRGAACWAVANHNIANSQPSNQRPCPAACAGRPARRTVAPEKISRTRFVFDARDCPVCNECVSSACLGA
eukprot:11168681-Lingulodinium_polyedra.AAC.1